MNRSGLVVKNVLKKSRCGIDDLLVVCDNLDLPPGTCRFKLKGSSAGQKGLASITAALGTDLFKRIYIGIGRPPAGQDVIGHVLGTPGESEATAIGKSIRTAADGIRVLMEETPEKALNFINSTRG